MMKLTIASNLSSSPLGTKVSIFSYPLLHIPNLYWFHYLAHKDLIPKEGGGVIIYVRACLVGLL